jgi:hypothetical protein
MFLPILYLSFVDDPPLFEEFSKVAFRRSVHRLCGDGLYWILHKVESLYCHQQKSSLALPNVLSLHFLSHSCAVSSFAVDHKLPHQNKTLTGCGK